MKIIFNNKKFNLFIYIGTMVLLCIVVIKFKQNEIYFDDYIIIDKIIKNNDDKKILDKSYVDSIEEKVINNEESFEKYLILGYCDYYNDRISEAKIKFEKAIDYIKDEKDLLCIAYNGQFLIECLSISGDYEKAREVYELTCRYIPTRQYNLVYKPILNMANGLTFASGESEVGIKELDNITEYLSYASDEIKIQIYKTYYQCYLFDENYSMSVKYLLQAIKLSEKIGDNYNLAHLTSDLGTMYCELRNYKESEKHILCALEIIKENNMQNTYLQNYVLMSLLNLKLDLEEYEEALDIAYEIENFHGELGAEISKDFKEMIDLLEVNKHINKEEFEVASNLLSNISKMIDNKETDSFYTYYFYYVTLGKLDEKQGHFEGAVTCYENSLNLSKEFDVLKVNLLNRIINVYRKLGNKELEADYQDILINKYKSDEIIRNQENIQNIINNVEKEYELIKNNDSKLLAYKWLLIISVISLMVIKILMKKLKLLEKQNITDELTGIYNRKYFDFYFNEIILKDNSISVIMIDIDDFKKINDTYGHDVGDFVIKTIAGIITNFLEEDDLAFRYGGEEFCILTQKTKNEVIDLAENIRSFTDSVKLKENLKVTISLGIGFKGSDFDIVKNADKKLYIAKKSGKNKVIY